MTLTAPSNEPPCPIWEEPPAPREMPHGGRLCNSPRAGGRFLLEYDGAVLLQSHLLTDRRRANLSYWIYMHNLDNGVFDDRGGKPLVVDQAWVEGRQDWIPSAEDRLLTFLREMIRSDDANEEQPCEELLLAAGGCRHDRDLKELRLNALDRGLLSGGGQDGPSYPHPGLIELDFDARIFVEVQLRERGENQQAVVPDPAKNESEFTISTNIQDLPIEEDVVPIVEERLDEARRAMGVGAHLSVIFLCGSVLEGVLIGAAQRDPENFNKANATPKTKTENGSLKPKPFHKWSLAELIDVACEIDVLKLDVKQFSHGLRDFRNYIHPHEQMKSGFTPDKHTAGLCLQALKCGTGKPGR